MDLTPYLSLGGTILAICVSHRGLSKQLKNNQQIAKDYLPILLELLENLDILQMALVYKGKFCPIIEHRCPSLSPNDGEADYSYAQRAQLFFVAGRKIIKCCREVIFLTPEGDLPKTKNKLTEIKTFLMHTKPGQKSSLEKIHQELLLAIAEREVTDDCFSYFEIISNFHADLDKLIELELPILRKL